MRRMHLYIWIAETKPTLISIDRSPSSAATSLQLYSTVHTIADTIILNKQCARTLIYILSNLKVVKHGKRNKTIGYLLDYAYRVLRIYLSIWILLNLQQQLKIRVVEPVDLVLGLGLGMKYCVVPGFIKIDLNDRKWVN